MATDKKISALDVATPAVADAYSAPVGKTGLNKRVVLGTAAGHDTGDYATAAQGATADSASTLATAAQPKATLYTGKTLAGQITKANTSNFTLTGAELVEQWIELTGTFTGAGQVQMPTATDIIAQIPNVKIGDKFDFAVFNKTTQAITLTVNTGVTFWPPTIWNTGNIFSRNNNGLIVGRGIVVTVTSPAVKLLPIFSFDLS